MFNFLNGKTYILKFHLLSIITFEQLFATPVLSRKKMYVISKEGLDSSL